MKTIKKLNPKQFFPKIKNSAKEFQRKLKKALKENSNSYSKINPLKFAISLGIINGLIILLTTLANTFNGSLQILTSIFLEIYGNFGYSISVLGSIIGGIYIFIDTFLITYLFIWIYNKLL
ncbi:MAG: hypothetical protein IH845_05490 [Nanoarchaeota archaeon]|nr:hypothetical protein [Nanoarchaeota archaeon]